MRTHHEPAFPQPLMPRVDAMVTPVRALDYGVGGMTRLELVATILHAANCASPGPASKEWALDEARAWLNFLDAHQNETPEGARENGGE